MINYYRINVSQNGKYLFATENGEGGCGITQEEDARKVTELFKRKFPKEQGYKIHTTYYQAQGMSIEF